MTLAGLLLQTDSEVAIQAEILTTADAEAKRLIMRACGFTSVSPADDDPEGLLEDAINHLLHERGPEFSGREKRIREISDGLAKVNGEDRLDDLVQDQLRAMRIVSLALGIALGKRLA